MFKNIEVFSREYMTCYSKGISAPCIIVSISDADASVPDLHTDNPNILDVLYLFFDDEESGPSAMTAGDAKKIVEFLKGYQDSDIDVYFHCNAGISRSAACAAAAQMIFWGDDSRIFNDAHYSPNMHCYREVLSYADPEYDEVLAARKERAQYALWAKENL